MKMDMDNDFNYKGYLPIHRSLLKLINSEILNITSLGWFFVFLSQSDFDSRHKRYGYLIRSDKVIAKEMNTSISAVSLQKNKLIKIGLLARDKKGKVMIHDFSFYTIKGTKDIENINLNKLTVSEQNIEKDNQKNVMYTKKNKTNEARKNNSFNVSSKDDLGLSKDDIDWIENNLD